MPKVLLHFRCNPKIKRMIDRHVQKLGRGVTLSSWVESACEKQLKTEMGLSYLWKDKDENILHNTKKV